MKPDGRYIIRGTEEEIALLTETLRWFKRTGGVVHASPQPLQKIPLRGGESTSPIERMKIVVPAVGSDSVGPNWLCCRKWDGTTLGTADVFVSRGPLSNVAGSVTYTFDDATTLSITYVLAGHQTRTATVTAPEGLTAQTEVIWPPYKVGDEIYAVAPDGGVPGPAGPADLTHMDLNVAGRTWVWRRST